MHRTTLPLLLLALVTLSACSTRQLYDHVSYVTRPDCASISNADERARCTKAADMPYEEYEKERAAARGK